MSMHIKRPFLPHLTGIGDVVPAVPLIFFCAACIAALQIPLSAVIKQISLPAGILINEIIVIAGLPLAIAVFMRFDRRILFPVATPRMSSVIPLSLLTIGAVILIDYATAGSETLFPLPEHYRLMLDTIMSVSSRAEFGYKFVLLCIVPGVCEEIFFRGFCQSALARRKGRTFALIATALLFAVMHGNPWHMHLYIILGLFLGWVYAASGTLIVPIACHIFNNAWTFTNHVMETTPPWNELPIVGHIAIVALASAAVIIGMRWFARTGAMPPSPR